MLGTSGHRSETVCALFPEVGGVLDRALGSLVSAYVRAQHTLKCTGAQREDCVSLKHSQTPDSQNTAAAFPNHEAIFPILRFL